MAQSDVSSIVVDHWVSIITARIRRMTGGYIFSLSTHWCVCGEGGGPGVSKGKNFWHQIWLDTCSDWKKKNFCRGTPPPLVKGKFFDTRFGLIHVQTGKKKIFVKGPPPLVKGKFFDTRFGLIHVQTGKKNFLSRTPPPSKGKIFWHQIWLDTCADWKKKFLSRAPLPPE